jgi:DNA-binding beta-propeller fold protein YncE
MLMRSLMGLLVSIMLAVGGTAGQGDPGGGKFLSLRATQFGGLGDFIENAIHDALFHSRGGVERFATLPKDGPGFPEGIAADEDGNIYVSTFDFTIGNVIHVFDRRGRLRTTTPVAGAPLGLAIGPDGHLYVANFGLGAVQRFALPLAPDSEAAIFPLLGADCTQPTTTCGLNAIAFDAAGDLDVSDSFGGRIFKIDLPAGAASLFFGNVGDDNELLFPNNHGFPGFGANGLAFSDDGTALFIANTADDRVLKLILATRKVEVFAESINGADGILFDKKGRLWVAANQGDEVVALNEAGRVVERRGSFQGVGRDGAPRGLLFPASIVVSRGSIFVTNLALALTEAEDDEPEEDVNTYTISRIRLGHHD